jgi:transposase
MQNTIAVDLAKTVFQIAVSHRPGHVKLSRRLTRRQFERFLSQEAPSRVLLEACGSAHYWARRSQAWGHTVTLLPPHHVRRYRAGNKTDRTDAKALLEAQRNDEIHPVPIKSEDQQALAALHRLRSGYTSTRTARINAVRGLLREFGLTIPVGARNVVPFVHQLESDAIPAPLRVGLLETVQEISDLEMRLIELERQLEGLARQNPVVEHLRTIPGIGLITATALVAFVGDIRRFRSARHFASYLGLVPREHASGLTRRLGSITKRGDTYLRMLLIHGARVVQRWARKKDDPAPHQRWVLEVEARRGHNIATVALANKLARFVWVIWKEHRDFRLFA